MASAAARGLIVATKGLLVAFAAVQMALHHCNDIGFLGKTAVPRPHQHLIVQRKIILVAFGALCKFSFPRLIGRHG